MKEYQLYDNARLLELLSESNELAFTEIYNRFYQKLFAIAYNRLKKMQESEDVVHDVFASLWTNRTKNEIELLDNYLATAVKYMIVSIIKKRIRERMHTTSIQEVPVIEMKIENALHYKRLLEVVKNEIEKLPEKCKLIFKYSRNEGMPVKQIAKELNISPKTVENQLNKALKQLKIASKTFLNFF